MTFVYFILAIVVAFAAYVRFAPSNPDTFHVIGDFDHDETMENGVKVVLDRPGEDFAKLDEIIRATPRTKVLAGTVGSGKVTYLTRSAGFGFPDYATVEAEAGKIRIHSRLRFGRSDLGVNGKRVKGWVKALGAN